MSRNSVYLSTGGQPYGFGGKERQRLGRAASYDFLARQYDPVLCRFTTMDPLAEKYYRVSPYAYCAGDPVNRVDPDGKIVVFAEGVSDDFKDKFNQAIKFMEEHGTSYLYSILSDSDIVYKIAEGEESNYDSNSFTLTWNPNIVAINNGTKLLRSPVTSLAHEFSHAVHHDTALRTNTMDAYYKNTIERGDLIFGSLEETNVITTTEQFVAWRHGEISLTQFTRYDHTSALSPLLLVNDEIILVKDLTQSKISYYVAIHNRKKR